MFEVMTAVTTVTGIDPTIVTGAVGDAVNSTVSMMSALLPYALTIFASVWGVKKAIRFFKGTAN